MKIACLNPNTNEALTALMTDLASARAPAGWQVDGMTVASGSRLITNDEELAAAKTAVLACADRLSGYDGVMVAAFGDPGARELGDQLDVPVVGIAAAAMAVAARHGPFAVVTTMANLEPATRALAEEGGHGASLVSVRATAGDPHVLMAAPDALHEALLAAVDAAVADGASAVVIGGGPLSRAAERLAPESSVPIIAPVQAALELLAERLADGRAQSAAPTASKPGASDANA